MLARIDLPLQIFEPRYRRLMQDLLALPEAGDQRYFGVVAIRQGWEVEQVAPAEALYDIGCTARVQAVRPQPDGGFRVVTVGGERFRLHDLVVGDDPPYLQAEVEWLVEEEQAEEAAGDHDGIVDPSGLVVPSVAAAGLEDVVASVARGSMGVLSRNVRDLFTRYVAEVAGLSAGEGEGAVPAVDAETAVLLHAVTGDPTAPTWASCASVGPAPSSSPSCQATTAMSDAPTARASTVATPRRRRRNQAAPPARSPSAVRISTRTESSATNNSSDGFPIATGPASVIRKSARGASHHQSSPASSPAAARTSTSPAELRRSARTSGQPRQ